MEYGFVGGFWEPPQLRRALVGFTPAEDVDAAVWLGRVVRSRVLAARNRLWRPVWGVCHPSFALSRRLLPDVLPRSLRNIAFYHLLVAYFFSFFVRLIMISLFAPYFRPLRMFTIPIPVLPSGANDQNHNRISRPKTGH